MTAAAAPAVRELEQRRHPLLAVLRLNYRNTAEVLSVAHTFAEDVLKPEDADEDGVPRPIVS